MFDNINIDLKRDQEQQEELQEIAGKIAKLLEEDFNEVVSILKNNWNGKNSVDYIRKFRKLQSMINETANHIGQAAKTMQIILKDTKETEKRNRALFHDNR